MSINAIVETVYRYEDGSGRLALSGEERGQPALYFDAAPDEVGALGGKQVWGSADTLMHGESKIADRVGYTKIVFVESKAFKAAITAESNRQREIAERRRTG